MLDSLVRGPESDPSAKTAITFLRSFTICQCSPDERSIWNPFGYHSAGTTISVGALMLLSTRKSSVNWSDAESNFIEVALPAMAWAKGRAKTLISSMFQATVEFQKCFRSLMLEKAKMSQNIQLWRCSSARSITASISTVLAALGEDAVGNKLP